MLVHIFGKSDTVEGLLPLNCFFVQSSQQVGVLRWWSCPGPRDHGSLTLSSDCPIFSWPCSPPASYWLMSGGGNVTENSIANSHFTNVFKEWLFYMFESYYSIYPEIVKLRRSQFFSRQGVPNNLFCDNGRQLSPKMQQFAARFKLKTHNLKTKVSTLNGEAERADLTV